MPPIIQPAAGSTHHLILKYGPPSSPTYQGLMLPDGDLKKYIVQPYTPFAPQSRQGNATIQDFSVATVWELNADWSGGTGHTRERKAESSVYAYAQGNNVAGGLGTTLFTAQKGKLLPAPAHANANVGGAIAAGNIKQFINFTLSSGASAGQTRLFGLSDENPGKIYVWSNDGLTPSLVRTLNLNANTTGVKLTTDGNKLWVTRGSTQKPQSTQDGTTWGEEATYITNPDFYDFGNTEPAGTDQAFQVGANGNNKCWLIAYSAANQAYVGWQGNPATNCAFIRGSIVIGKPEGLYVWSHGGVVECIFPCFNAADPINFSKMAVHNNLLWFNFKNRLFFTDLRTFTEVYPEDRGGFTAITSLTGTGGPLLIGAKWQATDAIATFQGPRSVTNPASDIVDDPISGSVVWTNPSNAGASDNVYATLVASGNQSSHRLKATNFGFSIPVNATITGIEVSVEAVSSVPDTWGCFYLIKNGGYAAAHLNAGPVDTIERYVSSGGANDLWNTTWTPADINASNFGAAVWNLAPAGGSTLSVDHIRVTVYYTVGGNPQNVLFALDSVQDAGLNPLWTDADGSNPMYTAYATSAPDASASRIYTCSDHANWKVRYIDLDTRFLPRTYDTNTTNVSHINLTEFSAGFASVKKWWYECVLNAVNPNQVTFAKAFYSIDGANFTQTLDQTGAAVEHTLNTRSLGSYFPLDATGTYNQLRLYLRTTASTGASAITTVTLRGDVMVKPRYQFQFPVDCSETVQPLQGVAENGNVIWKNLRAASQLDYPCRLQDPEGNWHLVLFRTSPYFAAVDYRVPNGGSKLVPYGIVTVVLEEIDALASDSSYGPWSAG